MRLKSEINQKREMIYMAAAILLTIALAFYLFWLVRSIVSKADTAFSTEAPSGSIPSFDFERYDKIMNKVMTPTSTLPLTNVEAPASPSATSSTPR